MPQRFAAPSLSFAAASSRRFAAIVACFGFLLIGWSSLVVPALATEIERTYRQDDAGLGFFYLCSSVMYAVGSVGGGILTERLGRRGVLVTAAVLHGVGLLMQAATGSWAVFVIAAIPRGIGSGAIDGGVNGLILDLYPEARGRALNAAHLFFALGGLTAPLAFGALMQVGVAWQVVAAVVAIASAPLAVGFVVGDMKDGRRRAPQLHHAEAAGRKALGLASLPVLALAVAIGCYVASEMGVSNWLVRFLSSAPIIVADAGLGLFWGGLTVGRLASAAWADRVDHLWLAVVASVASAVALFAAVLVPSLAASIVLFAVVGFAFGPVYPLIMAIAGERFPDRAAAVSGILSGAAVVGTILYPPLMGVMSVTVGLTVAMLGTAVIAIGGALALVASRYAIARSHRAVGETPVAADPQRTTS